MTSGLVQNNQISLMSWVEFIQQKKNLNKIVFPRDSVKLTVKVFFNCIHTFCLHSHTVMMKALTLVLQSLIIKWCMLCHVLQTFTFLFSLILHRLCLCLYSACFCISVFVRRLCTSMHSSLCTLQSGTTSLIPSPCSHRLPPSSLPLSLCKLLQAFCSIKQLLCRVEECSGAVECFWR